MSNKKILIVSYYWPPAGGPGVQRWLKFAKYLPEFGWNPIIYTPENPSYPIVDESLADEVSESVTVIQQPIWEPYQWAEIFNKKNKKFKGGQFETQSKQNWKSKISVWIRGNFFIPDARKFWVKPSVKFLKKYLETNAVDVLVTTGPPHSMHLIGLQLKKEFPHLFWVADFRDPWTKISYYQHLMLTPWADAKHKQLEKKVFQTANITLATSPSDAENFKNEGANAFCITNGFDTHEKGIAQIQHTAFSVSYVGVLEQLRNPSALWEAIGELCSENEDFKNHFQLQFAGRVDEEILKEIYQQIPKDKVHLLGYISHHDSFTVMLSSVVLVITNFPKSASKGIIPGKLFEYLSTGNKIVSIGPEAADVEGILMKTKAGKHFTYSQKNEMKSYLLDAFNAFIQKENLKPQLSEEVMYYSRKNLTAQLVNLLHEALTTR